MNTKYMILYSFSFVFSLNSMSPVDEYEHARQELKECRNSWSALIYGCDDQRVTYNATKERLQRPFKEITQQIKDKNRESSDALVYLEYERARKDFQEYRNSWSGLIYGCSEQRNALNEKKALLPRPFREKEELNPLQYYAARVMKKTIDRDDRGCSWYDMTVCHHCVGYHDDNRLPIDKQMIKEIESLKQSDYRWYLFGRSRHCNKKDMLYFLRPENAHNINRVAEEMKEEINKLQTKNNVQ